MSRASNRSECDTTCWWAGVLAAICITAAACGGGGGGDGGPGPGPEPSLCEGPGCVESAAGAAVSTVVSLTSTRVGVPGTATDAEAAASALADSQAPSPRAASRTSAGRRTLEIVRHAGMAALGRSRAAALTASGSEAAQECADCENGGHVCADCRDRNDSSTVNLNFSDCTIIDENTGNILVADGGLSITFAEGDLCTSGEVPAGTAFTTRFDGLSVVVREPSGALIGRVTADFTASTDPLGEGCAGENVAESLDGSLDVQSIPERVDVSLRFRSLNLVETSSGDPCTEVIAADGGLDVSDRANGRQFAATFRDFRVGLTESGDGDSLIATLDGGVSSSCFGEIELDTLEPVEIGADDVCPSAGSLALNRPDGTRSLIRFTAAGSVEFDYDGNGTVDRAVASCVDASVAQCVG